MLDIVLLVSIFTNRQDPEKAQAELEKRLEQKENLIKTQENEALMKKGI